MIRGVDSILAIDAATRTGWAFLDVEAGVSGASIFSGWQDFSVKDRGSTYHGLVMTRFERWLRETINELQPALIAYEIPHIGLQNRVSNNTTRLVLGGLYCTTMKVLDEHRLAWVDVPPKEHKKVVTGKGNASKSEVLAAVRNLGHDVDNTDQADAVAILLTSIAQLEAKAA